MPPTVSFVLLDENAKIPMQMTPGSAGYDMFALLDTPLRLEPGAFALVPTGVSISLSDAGLAAFLYARSGLATRHGITLSNGVGVIDSDYRGEIKIGLVNLSQAAYVIAPGERIAQLVFSPVIHPDLREVRSLDATGRAQGGFGSSGRT